jgi:hypothetical protein
MCSGWSEACSICHSQGHRPGVTDDEIVARIAADRVVVGLAGPGADLDCHRVGLDAVAGRLPFGRGDRGVIHGSKSPSQKLTRTIPQPHEPVGRAERSEAHQIQRRARACTGDGSGSLCSLCLCGEIKVMGFAALSPSYGHPFGWVQQQRR